MQPGELRTGAPPASRRGVLQADPARPGKYLRPRSAAACLADALDNRVEWGVWGKVAERERRALLRRRPNVASWRQVLESARREQEQPRAS